MPITRRLRNRLRLPVTGGMWLDDETRPPGHARLIVNVRSGEVRPGSQFHVNGGKLGDDPGKTDVFDVYPGGLFGYRTQQGAYHVFLLEGIGADGLTPQIVDMIGFRSAFVSSLPAIPSKAAKRIPATWCGLENHVLVAGPLDGQIGHIDLDESGVPSIGRLTLFDRGADPFSPGDDLGPYLGAPPRTVAICTHQDRLVMVTADGTVFFSNLRDPQAIPANNFFTLRNGLGYDKAVAAVSTSSGEMLVLQRDNVWVVRNDLSELRGTHVERAPFTNGPASPAAVQVVDGRVYGLGENGPWVYPGGDLAPGVFGPLFLGGPDTGLDIEKYRPTPAALSQAISRYCSKTGVVEWAIGVLLDPDTDTAEDRVLRLCWDTRRNKGWIEIHPSTQAFAAVEDGHDEEVLIRASGEGLLFFEGIGDFDEAVDNDTLVTSDVLINAEIQFEPIDATPERARLRWAHLLLDRRWNSEVAISVCADDTSADDQEQANSAAGLEDDTAFSSDGSSDGYRLGTDTLDTRSTNAVKRGLPRVGAGTRPWIRLHTPADATAGHRWACHRLDIEFQGGARGAT